MHMADAAETREFLSLQANSESRSALLCRWLRRILRRHRWRMRLVFKPERTLSSAGASSTFADILGGLLVNASPPLP